MSSARPTSFGLSRNARRALATVQGGRLRGVVICEVDPGRFQELRETFHHLLRTDLFGEVEVTLNERELPAPALLRGPAKAPPMRQAVYLLTRQEVGANGRTSACVHRRPARSTMRERVAMPLCVLVTYSLLPSQYCIRSW